MSEHLPMRWDPYTDPPELEPDMPEIEHQSARDGMTGCVYSFGIRAGFRDDVYGSLEAPWLIPLGGVVAHVGDGVADCLTERSPYAFQEYDE